MIRRYCTKLFFTSLNPLFAIATKRPVIYKDLPPLPSEIDPHQFLKKEPPFSLKTPLKLLLSILFLSSKKNPGDPDNRRQTVITCLLMLTRVGVSLLPPLLLREIILYFDDTHNSMLWGAFLIATLAFSVIIEGMVISHYFFNSQKLGFNILNILSLRIYRHNLRLTKEDKGNTEVGEMLNYMGTDTQNASEAPLIAIEFTHDMLVIVFVSLVLFLYLGIAALAPMALMLSLAPINKATSRKFARIDAKRRSIRDRRVSLITQTISAMRLVKYFVWEKRINQEVKTIRAEEVKTLRGYVQASVTAFSLYGAIRILTAITGFGLFLLLGNPLTPAIIFPCLALFKMLEAPFGDATHYIAEMMGTKIALNRILKFLNKRPSYSENLPHLPETKHQVVVKNLSVEPKNAPTPLLSELDFTVNQGKKIAIVGAIGSGKTVLLETLLGENSYQGEIAIAHQNSSGKAKVAFVSQIPVPLNASVRENILFGRAGKVSNRLLHNTCLEQDISAWPDGLDTEIGENGVNLSGGQKQRLSIARASFQAEDLILLDDPFSAVDPQVEKKLIERLFQKQWQETTVILSTHRFHCLPEMDQLIFLVEGKIEAIGTLQELLATNRAFQKFYEEHEKTKTSIPDTFSEVEEPHFDISQEKNELAGQFIVEEDRQFGQIERQIYLNYFKKLGQMPQAWQSSFLLFLMVLIAVLAAVIPIFQDLWLVTLSEKQSSSFLNWLASYGFQEDLKSNLLIYAIIGSFALFCLSFSHFIWRGRALTAAKRLHDQAWNRVSRASIRFFDTNPGGRVINRFSRDLDEVDLELGENFKKFIFAVVGAISNIFFMLTVVPALLLVFPFLAILSIRIQKKYLMLTRDLKRLSAVSRSPLLVFFKESLIGARQIRAFQQEAVFLERFCQKLYNNHQIELEANKLRWWYNLQNALVNSLLTGSLVLGAVWLIQQEFLSTSMAGLALTYALMFAYAIPQIIENFGLVQNQMTSVERLEQYTRLPLEVTEKEPLAGWPTEGRVEFQKVALSYDESLPLILKGVSFVAEPQKTLGIVGRTGSGKSTLFQALYRLIPVTEGQILIDGVDIGTLPLEQLRRQMAIVPQDPVLFPGTVMSNLDFDGQWTEATLLEKLRQIRMLEFIESLQEGVLTQVEEDGENLSLGQRQLICLARALLLDTKIFLMDEATASLDLETEKYLRQVLEQVYQHKTVLLIAHRPESIRDCDQILTLSEGRNVENPSFPRSEIEFSPTP